MSIRDWFNRRVSLSVFKYSENVEVSNFLSAAVWNGRELSIHRPTRLDCRVGRCELGIGGILIDTAQIQLSLDYRVDV